MAEWGLIPSWIKTLENAKDLQMKTLNAVGETVFEKPSFRNAIAKKRCLLGVNGFYEWRDFNKKKYPYFISVKGEEIFSLGCIYEEWIDRSTGEIRTTFSILTTPANPLMEKIHNLKKRMPLILPREAEAAWIDPASDRKQIETLIRPFDENKMQVCTVGNFVNSSRANRNVPEAMKEELYPALPAISSAIE